MGSGVEKTALAFLQTIVIDTRRNSQAASRGSPEEAKILRPGSLMKAEHAWARYSRRLDGEGHEIVTLGDVSITAELSVFGSTSCGFRRGRRVNEGRVCRVDARGVSRNRT